MVALHQQLSVVQFKIFLYNIQFSVNIYTSVIHIYLPSGLLM